MTAGKVRNRGTQTLRRAPVERAKDVLKTKKGVCFSQTPFLE